jgi:hypothetical protein
MVEIVSILILESLEVGFGYMGQYNLRNIRSKRSDLQENSRLSCNNGSLGTAGLIVFVDD